MCSDGKQSAPEELLHCWAGSGQLSLWMCWFWFLGRHLCCSFSCSSEQWFIHCMSDTRQACLLRRCPEQSPLQRQRALITAQTLQMRGTQHRNEMVFQMETIPHIWCAYTSMTVLKITVVEQSALTKWTTDSVITWEGASPSESSSPPVPGRLIQK